MARADCKETKVGKNWILGGDFNAIRDSGEKKRRKLRSEGSCHSFKEFRGNCVSWQAMDLG